MSIDIIWLIFGVYQVQLWQIMKFELTFSPCKGIKWSRSLLWPIDTYEFLQLLLSGSIISLTLTKESINILQWIWQRICEVPPNISPSNLFLNILLHKRFHWYCKAAFGLCLPFQCWGYFHFKHMDEKIFVNHLNPVILVFIRQLSQSTLRWVPICQGFRDFSGFLHYLVLAKIASSSISVQ